MLSEARYQERINFILHRVRAGLSRCETLKQFAQEFGTGRTQTAEWYKRALDSLILDDPKERERLRAGIVEMYHAQIAGCQRDLNTIQQEIDKVDGWWEQRDRLFKLLAGNPNRHEKRAIEIGLERLPRLTVHTKTNLIESKNKVRDRLIDLFEKLARVHGLYTQEMPWMQAVQILLDNGILPSESAETILDKIQALNASFEKSTRVDLLDLQ